jgi:hypothetical protein
VPSCDPTAAGSIVADCEDVGRECDDGGVEVLCGDCLVDFIEVDGLCVTNDCIGLDCSGQGRVCDTEVGTLQESCGNCDTGHVLDAATDTCIDRRTCADSPCVAPAITCDEATPTNDRTCRVPENCPFNQVEKAGVAGCFPCNACFENDLSTLKAGVRRTAVDENDNNKRRPLDGDICVCDLLPGFFQSSSDGRVTSCDADGDGWVTEGALATIGLDGGTSPLAQEQTCTIRKIDRFELQTDDGAAGNAANSGGLVNVARSKVVTVSDIVEDYGLPSAAFEVDQGIRFVELIEPAKLDEPGTFAQRYDASANSGDKLKSYGGVDSAPTPTPGSMLLASEANPLTKACNDDNDDLNFDGVKDVVQTHEYSTPPDFGPLASQVFYRMSYFIELNRGFFKPCASGEVGCLGTYVIAEKRRAPEDGDPRGLNLRLNYNDDGGVLGDFGEVPYWQQCMRGREPDYAPNANDTFNTDFARWYDDCDPMGRGCQQGGGIAYDGRDPGLPNDERFPAEGASLTGRWPGMGHHSQFKCVSFASTDDADIERRPPPPPALVRTKDLLTSADPAGLADGANMYAYVHNDPINTRIPLER